MAYWIPHQFCVATGQRHEPEQQGRNQCQDCQLFNPRRLGTGTSLGVSSLFLPSETLELESMQTVPSSSPLQSSSIAPASTQRAPNQSALQAILSPLPQRAEPIRQAGFQSRQARPTNAGSGPLSRRTPRATGGERLRQTQDVRIAQTTSNMFINLDIRLHAVIVEMQEQGGITSKVFGDPWSVANWTDSFFARQFDEQIPSASGPRGRFLMEFICERSGEYTTNTIHSMPGYITHYFNRGTGTNVSPLREHSLQGATVLEMLMPFPSKGSASRPVRNYTLMILVEIQDSNDSDSAPQAITTRAQFKQPQALRAHSSLHATSEAQSDSDEDVLREPDRPIKSEQKFSVSVLAM